MREVLKSRVRVSSLVYFASFVVNKFRKPRRTQSTTKETKTSNSGLNAIAGQSRLRNPGEFSAAATIVR